MNKLKIFSWNVNGIRAAIKKGFIDFLNEYDPDIICLQETKAQREQVEIDVSNYEEYWNSAEKKGYSGTAIFTKIKPLNVFNDINIAYEPSRLIDSEDRNSANEGRVIVAEYNDFYVANVYTPNSKRELTRLELRHKHWDPIFLEYMESLNEKKPVVFCGDLNVAHKQIDLARPDTNEGEHGFTKEEREGFDNIIKSGFIDSFRHFNKEGGNYTWWTPWRQARQRNIGWRIDYICVSEQLSNNLISANIHPEVMGSDHCPVSIEIEI